MDERINVVASAYASAMLTDFLAQKRERKEQIKNLEDVQAFIDYYAEAAEHFPELFKKQGLWE